MGMWTIMEDSYGGYDHDMDFRSSEEAHAYKMGCKRGYEKAMREMRGSMDYRGDYTPRGGYNDGMYGNRDYGNDGMSNERRFPGYFPEGPYMGGMTGYRGGDEMDERRRRDSRGRYM